MHCTVLHCVRLSAAEPNVLSPSLKSQTCASHNKKNLCNDQTVATEWTNQHHWQLQHDSKNTQWQSTKWCKELVVSATSTLILVCLNLQHHQQKWGQFQCQTVSNLNALQWLTSQKFWRRPLKKTRQFWCWTQKFKPLSWLWLQSKQRVWWKWLQQCLHGLSFNTLEVQLVPKKELQFPNFQKRTLNLQSTPTTHSDCKHNLKFHEC